MKLRWVILATMAILPSVSIANTESTKTEKPAANLYMGESDAETIGKIAARGVKLYRYDQAAWHSTDALREDIKNLGKSGIKGWIIVPDEKGLRAIY